MKDKLSNADILFIRACKIGDSQKTRTRIDKVYKKFYHRVEGKKPEPIHLASILLDICEMTKPMKLKNLLSEMNPYSNMFFKPEPHELITDNDSYWERVLNAAINNIRFTSIDDLGDSYSKGALWRKRDKQSVN